MDLLGIRSLPFLTRRNYLHEFQHILLWSIPAGLVEGHFASIVVARTFLGSKLLITIATATIPASYLFSLIWGMLCVGRPKIRLMTMFIAGTVFLLGAIAAIPNTSSGAIWFLMQMAAAQILFAGVVTVRSAVWKSNYPKQFRGQIIARLQAIRFVISITTVLIAAIICDVDPMSYRYIFPIAATFGLISLVFIRRIHIRGERNELIRLHQPTTDTLDRVGLAEPFTLTALMSPGHVIGRMVQVLKKDRRYLRYCIAQSFTGLSNLMTLPIIVVIITQDMDIGYRWGFWISAGLIQAIPQLVRMGSIFRWSKLFDRIGVVHFRVINVLFWTISSIFGLFAALVVIYSDRIGAIYFPLAVILFVLRGMVNGLALGGGSLAWNIGHLHFAKSDEAEFYMGIHVFLTGIRGLIAPAGGMLLWSLIGWPVWLVALLFSLISLHLYSAMSRDEKLLSAEISTGGLT